MANGEASSVIILMLICSRHVPPITLLSIQCSDNGIRCRRYPTKIVADCRMLVFYLKLFMSVTAKKRMF